MIIRKCGASDVKSVYELIKNELGYSEITENEVAERFERMITPDAYSVLVAEIDGMVCGFVSMVREISLEINGELLRIIGLAVKAEYQRKGIGAALLKEAEQIAAERKMELITLSSNFKRPEAHKFYDSQGYLKTSYTFKKFMR